MKDRELVLDEGKIVVQLAKAEKESIDSDLEKSIEKKSQEFVKRQKVFLDLLTNASN